MRPSRTPPFQLALPFPLLPFPLARCPLQRASPRDAVRAPLPCERDRPALVGIGLTSLSPSLLAGPQHRRPPRRDRSDDGASLTTSVTITAGLTHPSRAVLHLAGPEHPHVRDRPRQPRAVRRRHLERRSDSGLCAPRRLSLLDVARRSRLGESVHSSRTAQPTPLTQLVRARARSCLRSRTPSVTSPGASRARWTRSGAQSGARPRDLRARERDKADSARARRDSTGAQSLTNEVSADASALIGKYSPCSAEWMRTALIVVRLLDPFFLQRRQRTDLRILTLLHPRSGFHANLLRQTPSVHAHPHQIVSVSGSLQLSIALTALSNSGCSSSRGGASGPAAAAAPAQSLGRPATGGMRSLGTRLAHRRGRYARVGGTRSSAGLAGSDEDEDEERRLRGRGDGQGSSGEGESDLDEAPWTEEGRRAPRVVV